MARKDTPTGKYAVLIDFTDSEDNLTLYRAGKDIYPRNGYDPADDRVEYLQGSNNVMGKPIIAKK